jgi:uncharacterized membrane protein YgdD (TMEM256/DUF423 family)
MDKILGVSGAVLGATSVAAGAFGAHYLSSRFDDRQMRNWQTATTYGLVHSAVIVATANDPRMRRAQLAWALGTTLFSGSIYGLSLDLRGPLGIMTPLGGTVMIGGWLLAAVARL